MRRTVPPSAEIERKIDELLAGGIGASDPQGPLSEPASLGAKLIIQRAVEGGVRRLHRPSALRAPPRGAAGQNGWRPRRVQSAEGEIEVELPQLREAAVPAITQLSPHLITEIP